MMWFTSMKPSLLLYALLCQLIVSSLAEFPKVPASELREWPWTEEHLFAIDDHAISEVIDTSWETAILQYLDGTTATIAQVDCVNDPLMEVCQLLNKHHVMLVSKDQLDHPRPLEVPQQKAKLFFIKSMLELLVAGVHVTSCETPGDVAAISENGALVTVVTDRESSDYLLYLKRVPFISNHLQRPVITTYSLDTIPVKKQPKKSAALLVWYVVAIGDQIQWSPMERKGDIMTDITEFIDPLRYPIIHEYRGQETVNIYKTNTRLQLVYFLMVDEQRKEAMKLITSLAKKHFRTFSFITADYNRYKLEISNVDIPAALTGKEPYIIIKPLNYEQIHSAPGGFPYNLNSISALLTSVIQRDFEKKNPQPNVSEEDFEIFEGVGIIESLNDFKISLATTNRYILAAFCVQGSRECHRLLEVISPIGSAATNIHDNLVVLLVECNRGDKPPGGLSLSHFPSVSFYDYTDKSWTEYRHKISLDAIHTFLSEVLQLSTEDKLEPKEPNDLSDPKITFGFSNIEEDNELNVLANELGAADLTNITHLSDASIDPFISQYDLAVVAFYQIWCVQSKLLLHHMPTIQQAVSPKVGVALVSCSDWPDVCDRYNITVYPTVLVFRASQVIQYNGPLSGQRIVDSLSYYRHNGHTVTQLEDTRSLLKLITNCRENNLKVAIGIFTDQTSNGYQQFVGLAKRYHGRRVFGVLVDVRGVPAGLPVEVTQLPAILLALGGGDTDIQIVTDQSHWETRLLGVQELTPATLPDYISAAANMPLLVVVVAKAEGTTHPLVAKAASMYPLVSWLDYETHGQLVSGHLSSCDPPALLLLDYSSGDVYRGDHCGQLVTTDTVERLLTLHQTDQLSPTGHFEPNKWKPESTPLAFPSAPRDDYNEGGGHPHNEL